MKKILGIVIASSIVGVSAAQTNGFIDGGLLSRMVNFKTTDMAAMSLYDYTQGTARSSAMSGAFTSLGADLSSMSINPAGLGMYRGSEFGISLSVPFSSITNSRALGIDNLDGNKTSFSLGNLGAAFNLYEGSGALTSFTMGFGYNRLVNFNSRNTFGMAPDQHSIADMFALQLKGVNPNTLNSGSYPFDNNSLATEDWGAILGYQTSLIDSIPQNMYMVNAIDRDATSSHYVDMKQSGYVGEYNISGGFNFSNIFYMGFSLGIQDIYYKTTANYEEAYVNNPQIEGYLDYIKYGQAMKMSGSGVNFKFGVTVQPIQGLKIGVAVHTPTYVSLDRDYQAGMLTVFNPTAQGVVDTGDKTTPNLAFSPKYTSPPRLLTGISYVIKDIAIISADYERVWYNGMRMKDEDDYVNSDFKSQIKNDFKGQNNFRIGAEVRPIPSVAIRAGYRSTGTCLNDNSSIFNAPIVYKQQGFSAGVGYRSNAFSVDLAYSFTNSKYTEYDLYYFDGANNDGNNVVITTGGITQKMNFNNITLSFGMRF